MPEHSPNAPRPPAGSNGAGATCWRCGTDLPGPPAAKFCPQCKALQRPPEDYFEFFEFPRQLALDPKELEKRFYALSRRLHPDLFSRKSDREREYSLESTAILNDGYRILKDPVQRAQYVLKKEGLEIGEQGEQGKKDVPAELLEEVFALNMALEEMGGGDGDAREQVAETRKRFEAARAEIDSDLEGSFRKWDAGHSPDVLASIRGLLNRRKYITNLIAQTETA